MSQFEVVDTDPGIVRVVFRNGDRNMLDGTTTRDLEVVLDTLEARGDIRVAVLESGNPDYFMARFDISGEVVDPGDPFGGLRRFLALTLRLGASPIVWIALIRGRARGGGNEIALACDLRYASAERTILGQPEVPSGLLPAGGGIERLTELVGRSRALEVVATGDDYDATTAERYGWVTRAVPDAGLDTHVNRIARRIAAADEVAVATSKRLTRRVVGDEDAAVQETIAALPAIVARTGARRRELIARAAAEGPSFELHLGVNRPGVSGGSDLWEGWGHGQGSGVPG